MLWDFRSIDKSAFVAAQDAQEVAQIPLLIPQQFNGDEITSKWESPDLNLDYVFWKKGDLEKTNKPVTAMKNTYRWEEEIQRQARRLLERNYSDILEDVYAYSVPNANGGYTIEAQGRIIGSRKQKVYVDISENRSSEYDYKPGDIVKVTLALDTKSDQHKIDNPGYWILSHDFYKISDPNNKYLYFWDNSTRFPDAKNKGLFSVVPQITLGKGSLRISVYRSGQPTSLHSSNAVFRVPLLSGTKVFTYNENLLDLAGVPK